MRWVVALWLACGVTGEALASPEAPIVVEEALVAGADVVAWHAVLSSPAADQERHLTRFVLTFPDSPLAVSAYGLLMQRGHVPVGATPAERMVLARMKRLWGKAERSVQLGLPSHMVLEPLDGRASGVETPASTASSARAGS